MKTTMTIILMAIAITAAAQLTDVAVYQVDTDTNIFDKTVKAPAIIFDKQTKESWMITHDVLSNASLSTVDTKYLLSGESGTEPPSDTPTFKYLTLVPQTSFPQNGIEGRLVNVGGTLFMYQDNDYRYYFPMNKELNGVKISINE